MLQWVTDARKLLSILKIYGVASTTNHWLWCRVK
nr:MAG TPA: hypothetical protein [Caudoviricetes sp.]